jgi:hypothetical protein
MSVLGKALRFVRNKFSRPEPELVFSNSAQYWEQRYAMGGNSGCGSFTKFAEFKAEVINNWVRELGIQSVIEFGCGDGNQLSLAHYPRYVGYDVSRTAVEMCRRKFQGDPSKQFKTLDEYRGETAELAMSLDVIYHLIENDVFEDYMKRLFNAATRYVIIYSSDQSVAADAAHVQQRRFTPWIDSNLTGWKLESRMPNRYPYRGDYTTGSWSEFFLYQRTA